MTSVHGIVWMPRKRRLAIAAVLPLLLVAGRPSWGQDYNQPQSDVDDPRGMPPGGGYRPGGMDMGDPAAVSVRVGKLESRIREMTGQIEELQNANRKLVEQLQKFQADVEFRLQEKGGRPPHRAEAAPVGGADPVIAAAPKVAESRSSRNDAFDPRAEPTAPGAPKPLGTVASASPADDAPMDLTGAGLAHPSSSTLAPTLPLPSATPKASGETLTPNGTIIANIAPNSPKEAFDLALGYYKDKQYESAEKGFAAFIDKNPKSRLVADATYYIGESFAQRGRPREAAEQYLKISTDYANSARAPEAMLHLGISLKALGAKDQACAAFTEVGHKYPNAPTYVKTGAEREAKRAQC
jgi:tol-pal system protein YbgF